MVVGNSTLRGFKIDNAQICADALEAAGLSIDEMAEREIPTRSRYLPTNAGSALASRMRVEVVISASKPEVPIGGPAALLSKLGTK